MAAQGLPVRTYKPQLEFKIVLTNGQMVDFTGDVADLTVRRTVRDMVNQWSVVLRPRDDSNGTLLYDRIEPMTYAQIRLRHVGDSLTTAIRGFVTSIRKTVSVASGRPVRTITITGENYGKVLRISYFLYMFGYNPWDPIKSTGTKPGFLLETNSALMLGYGVDAVSKNSPPSSVITQIFNSIPYKNFNNIRKMIFNRKMEKPATAQLTQQDKTIPDFQVDADSAGTDGERSLNLELAIMDPQLGAKNIAAYDLIKEVAMAPWNEIYVEDTEDTSYLVFRPMPWRDRYGTYIGGTSFNTKNAPIYTPKSGREDYAKVYNVPFEDILSYDLSRDDNDTFSYYFTNATAYSFGNSYLFYCLANLNNKNPHWTTDDVDVKTVPTMAPSNRLEFSRIELFGFRALEVSTPYFSFKNSLAREGLDTVEKTLGNNGIDLTDEQSQRVYDMWNIGGRLNTTLFHALEQNSALENGMITLKGREDIKPGHYVQLSQERNDAKPALYYVTDVVHEVIPYESFITKIMVIRGERHLNYLRDIGFIS